MFDPGPLQPWSSSKGLRFSILKTITSGSPSAPMSVPFVSEFTQQDRRWNKDGTPCDNFVAKTLSIKLQSPLNWTLWISLDFRDRPCRPESKKCFALVTLSLAGQQQTGAGLMLTGFRHWRPLQSEARGRKPEGRVRSSDKNKRQPRREKFFTDKKNSQSKRGAYSWFRLYRFIKYFTFREWRK